MESSSRVRFVTIGMARSGTTVIQQALQGHPNVRSSMDELKVAPFFTKGIAVFTVSGVNDFERDNGYGVLIDALSMIPCGLKGMHLLGYGGTEAVPKATALANGVKVAVGSQAEAEDLAKAFETHESLRDVAVVRIERRDLVAQFASLQRAMRSGRWHSFYHAQPTVSDPNAPFECSGNDFHFYCQEAIAIRAAFDRIGKCCKMVQISYEDEIAKDVSKASGRVFQFLGLPVVAPTWLGSEKVAPPLATFVTNTKRLYEIFRKYYPDAV